MTSAESRKCTRQLLRSYRISSSDRLLPAAGAAADPASMIESAVAQYRVVAGEDLISWRAFDALYSVYLMDPPGSIPDLCQKWHCRKSTLYQDLRKAESNMARFIFPEE